MTEGRYKDDILGCPRKGEGCEEIKICQGGGGDRQEKNRVMVLYSTRSHKVGEKRREEG